MYQHLLVPVDSTELSTVTVSQAVKFASQLNAQITFLYATPDFSATSDGALLLSVAPQEYSERAQGGTQAILAKVAEQASAKGVVHHTVSMVTDHPYVAILNTAKEKGCDLIFMASHGQRGLLGLLRGSQTEKVLHHSTIPVLVSSVESNGKK